MGEAVCAMTEPQKTKTKKTKKTGNQKSEVRKTKTKDTKSKKSEPEIIILERTKPEAKKKSEAEALEIGVEPNNTEQARTDSRKVTRGILAGLVMVGIGLTAWRVVTWQGNYRRENGVEQVKEVGAEPEMTEEEKAAEAERQRQAELAEQERQRQEEIARERQQRAEQIEQASTSGRPLVALTFDDGPSGATTPRLLDILKEKNVKVTFFVLGGMLSARPDISQRAEAEGHEVESHTMTHKNLEKATLGEIQWEVASMNQVFQEKLGHVPKMTRPPYGNGIRRAEVTQNIGTPMIYWSVDTEDWRSRNAAAVQERIRQDAYDGAIILMHDIYPSTVDAVAGVIDEFRAREYEFVTVEELAKARGVEMVNGVTYFNFKP